MATLVTFNGNQNSVSRDPNGSHYWIDDRAPVTIGSEPLAGAGQNGTALSFEHDGTGATTGFARYQGAKLTNGSDGSPNFDLGYGSAVSARFYIDPAWADDGAGQISGVWAVLNTADNSSYYSIAEYVDPDAVSNLKSDPGNEIPDEFTGGFRFWNSTEGWAEYVNVTASGWVKLDFVFGQESHTWTVSQNGTTLADYNDTDVDNLAKTTSVATVIVNSQNFGAAEQYQYDDITLVRAGTTLTDAALDNGNLIVGSGNPSSGFATIEQLGLELGLSVRETYQDSQSGLVNPDLDPPIEGVLQNGTYHFARNEGTDPFTRVAYSVASLEANTSLADKLQDYDIKLTYDRNASVTEEQTVFILRANGSQGYEWVYDANGNGSIDDGENQAITDDEGSPFVTQNIQNPSWYDLTPLDGTLVKGSYDIRLQVVDKDTKALLAENHIVIDIDGGATVDPSPDPEPGPFVPPEIDDPSPDDGFNEAQAAASVVVFFESTPPTPERQEALNAFANLHYESYKAAGVLNPELGPFEALGRGFAETDAFAAQYGLESEADFIATRYVEVFGRAATDAQQEHFQAQIDYFELIYESAGITSEQADLFAKGAILGQMIGHATLEPVGTTAQAGSTAFAWDLVA